ncbi:MAG: putative maltokinase, partial [Methylobacteriaceae bacterium]|nr:putative maltokinase [Methylobacteriaceae bacterium]
GMGDNIYLGDRDGVRTPMQWSPDRNGGFSRSDPARLFLPTIQDAIYGFDAVNVESQSRSPASLYNWMRRLIAIRRATRAFGRGTLKFLYPANRKVLAYIREAGDERILCVVNVSRAPQAVELDLSEYNGMTPVEMTGGTAFPRVGELPYLLTLPAYGFYWFQLTMVDGQSDTRYGPAPQPELFTLVLTGGLASLLQGRERMAVERTIGPRMIAGQRWFAAKGRVIDRSEVIDFAVMRERSGREGFVLPRAAISLRGGERQEYFVPIAVDEAADEEALGPVAVARVRRGRNVGLAYGAGSSAEFALSVVDAMRFGETLETERGGQLRFSATRSMPDDLAFEPADVKRLSGEQSNTSIAIGDRVVLKLYRRLQPGIHPEVEVGRFLTEVAGYENTPATLGVAELVEPDGETTALMVLQRFVRNQGDAWRLTLDTLTRELDTLALAPLDEEHPLDEVFGPYLRYAEILGLRTGELHAALATPTEDPAFAAEALGPADVALAAADARDQAERAFAALGRTGGVGPEIEALRTRRDECLALIDALAASAPEGALKIRIHGDYHLGQILIVQDDVMIVDFEGEPARPADERRGKFSPLRDVAGMLRSFAYAADTAAREIGARLPEAAERVAALAAEWQALTEARYLEAYERAATSSRVWVRDEGTRRNLLRLSLLAKALYEVNYEANNRPDWIGTPVRGVLSILDAGRDGAGA